MLEMKFMKPAVFEIWSRGFETDKLLRKVVFLLKMRAKRSSYDKPFLRYDSGGFRRFLAVSGGFGTLCFSITFGTDKLLRNVAFLLKMRAKRSSYDQRFSRYKFGGFSAVFGGFGPLWYSITFRTDILLRNVAFMPKMRAKRSSYDQRFTRYDSGGFRRFLAVFGGFGTLCYSIAFGTDKLLRNVAFLLKMRAKRSSYDQRFSRYKFGGFSAVFGGFRENASSPARSPPRVVFRTIKLTKKSWSRKFPRKLTPSSFSRWSIWTNMAARICEN